MKRPSIKCPECAGVGTVPLPEHLEQTLAALGGRTKPAEYLSGAGLTINAISNRLADLLKLGLVTRHKEGRQWFYRAARKAKPSESNKPQVPTNWRAAANAAAVSIARRKSAPVPARQS